MRALVIGASGQIGGHLLAELGRRGHAAVGTRRSFSKITLPRLDIANAADVRAAVADLTPDVVFLPAGFTWVDGCEKDPARAFQENRDWPLGVARAARDRGALFVFFSTDYVFDGKAGPYAESAPTHALSVYGRSKLEAEELLRAEVPDHLILRATTVFGPEVQGKNFVYQLIAHAREKKTMRVPSDQYATPSYSPDIACAAIDLAEQGARGTFHVTGPDFLDRATFARRACDVLGLDPSFIAPATTAELGQPAPRPLLAGLRSEKLDASITPVRGAEAGLRAFRDVVNESEIKSASARLRRQS